MTNEQLWVLVMRYERIIARLLEQLDGYESTHNGQP